MRRMMSLILCLVLTVSLVATVVLADLNRVTSAGGIKQLINAVLANATGRDLFLSRYAELMGTVLNEEYIVGYLDGLVETILPEMEKDRERWGCSYAGWEKSVEDIRKFVRDGVRTQGILNDLQSCFKLTDAEMEHYFAQFMQ